MEKIFGFIERITFCNPENGFTVAKLKETKKKELTTLVGILPSLKPGETVSCEGDWKFNSQHGAQFEVKSCEMQAPQDLLGIRKYLESGLIKGIGPVYAERIVKQFGIHTLAIIDESPDKLLDVPGIATKKLERIKTCWEAQKSIRTLMIFLQRYGASPAFAQRLFKTYGADAIQKVQENPYAMARDIFGIGFKTADAMAEKMGIGKDAPGRILAGIEYVLHELSNEGHTCFPETGLIEKVKEILQVEEIGPSIETLLKEERIVRQDGLIWLKMFYLCEKGIARELARLQQSLSRLRPVDAEKAITWVQATLDLQLAEHQKKAVAAALAEKVLIITGGPGTGKSTITKAILTILEKLTRRILLAAPTGRASKRMSEITKKEAKTIHSLLQWSFTKNGFQKDRSNPLECDLIIVDEASMIDTHLMYSLLKAIPSHARLILIGDVNQLPSVGAGNVLKDMITSKKIPIFELTEIFRQAKDSKIVVNAHRINQGEFPDLDGGAKSDFFFLKANEPQEVQRAILQLVTERLPRRYKLNPIDDIQVLIPMKKGIIGTERMNFALQEALNPTEHPYFIAGKRFHLHDKVMQIRNNYDKEVFNGDLGRLTHIDTTEQEVTVSFEGRKVVYDFSELDELVLAYAVSVHKYQGSECPCVIIPVHTSHFILLHRNLLYTAITRGKKLVVLVGSAKAIHIALNNNEIQQRCTHLSFFIET